MRKILFIDRDGTLIKEPPDTYQVDTLEQLEFLPGVLFNLRCIVRDLGYELVMVTNQDGLGTLSNPLENFNRVQHKMMQVLENEGIRFSAIHIDDSFPEEGKPTRKPGTAMLTSYMDGSVDMLHSFVIGDRVTDIQLARNMGTRAIFIRNYEQQQDCSPDLAAESWDQIYAYLRQQSRSITHRRKTNETDIRIALNPDGSGKHSIETGIGFFDHMLEQIARHGNIDLEIIAKGDLHIDEHHTIEDTGIAMGEAFKKALADKRGMERYGYCLPMDDAMAQVALDFGGRSWIVWDAEFKREMIGGMPTEMFFHFFKSFCDGAACNLNIKAEGINEHHKIEAVFKAFARAIKMAVKVEEGNRNIPSTKGCL
jgi:imidazoleglycerol-phosphate dehydratase/histidinol-phosphatase